MIDVNGGFKVRIEIAMPEKNPDLACDECGESHPKDTECQPLFDTDNQDALEHMEKKAKENKLGKD